MNRTKYKELKKKGWNGTYTGIYKIPKNNSYFILEWMPFVIVKMHNKDAPWFNFGYFCATRIYPKKNQKTRRVEILKFENLPRKWIKIY